MFYKDEALSGYWGEKDEYGLAHDLELPLPSGTISAKVINIAFYQSAR